MRIKLTWGGDFSRFGCGICEPGVTINVPDRDGIDLVACGAATELQPLSQQPISITVNIKESIHGNS